MRCRSSMKASSPSICGPARMPACSTSAIWASCSSPARDVEAALETPAPGRPRHPEGRPAAHIRCCSTEDGGIIDDLMVDPPRRAFLPGRQRRHQAGRHRPSRGAAAARRRRRSYEGAGAARAAGAEGGRRARRGSSPGVEELELHDGGPRSRSAAASRCGSAARAIPARTGSRFRSPARDAEAARRRAARRRAEVKPIGLGARDSLRLEAGLPLYGHDLDHDDHAGRGGPHLRAIASAAAPRAASPAGTGSLAELAERADPQSASASPSRAASRSARARWCSTPRAMRSARSLAAASRRASRRRSPWPMCRSLTPSRAPQLTLAQRGKLFTGDGRADAVRSAPLSPQGSRLHERLLHQGA